MTDDDKEKRPKLKVVPDPGPKSGREDDVPAEEAGAWDGDESEDPRVFVVGLGRSGRELIERLRKSSPVAGLDLSEKKVEKAGKLAASPLVKLAVKDGASRLTWQDLGLRSHDVVVAVTDRDESNLEVCRVVRDNFGVKRLIGLIHADRWEKEYERLGVEVVARAKVLASFLESRVLRDRRTAMNVGLGEGEIMEVTILPGSPVIGRALKSFHARPWLVGAIYRKDRLVVPHGHSRIQEGDRVVLVGEPLIIAEIAEFFKMGEPEFPLQFGPRIGMLAMEPSGKNYETMLGEANYLAANSKATSLAMLSVPGMEEPDLDEAEQIRGETGLAREPAYLHDQEHTAWPRALQAQDFGCLVISDHKLGVLKRIGLINSLLRRILEDAQFPVLVAKGSHPYQKILVPVATKSSPFRIAQLAINLARLFKAKLDAVTVTEPAFAAGQEAVEEQKGVLDRVVEMCSLYRLPVNITHREGNPIEEIVEQAADYDLVVLGQRQGVPRFPPKLDLSFEILVRAPCSVMILPFKSEP